MEYEKFEEIKPAVIAALERAILLAKTPLADPDDITHPRGIDRILLPLMGDISEALFGHRMVNYTAGRTGLQITCGERPPQP